MTSARRSEPRLLLIRHGRSAHVHAGWIDSQGFRGWRSAYEAAGIRDDERPPEALQRLTSDAEVVLSSDAARALASARRLAPGRKVRISPLLRELDLEPPGLRGVRLPLAAWAVAVGVRVALQSVSGRHPSAEEATRLDAAAAWLDKLARRHVRIAAVTHASFRRLLVRRLLERGWSAAPGPRTVKHWSAWQLQPPAEAPGAMTTAQGRRRG